MPFGNADDPPTLFVFLGVQRASPVERMVSGAWQALALDTLARAQETGAFRRIVVATNCPKIEGLAGNVAIARPGGPPIEVDVDAGAFHFGQRLRGLVRRYDARRVLYLGAGSAPLLTAAELASAADMIGVAERAVLSNNYYSADIVGFAPGEALDGIDLPRSDNDLPYRLVQQGGLRHIAMPRGAGTMLDVDTPTDLAVLRLHPGIGPSARRYLATAPLDTVPIASALPVLADPSRQVVVAGRVSQAVWARLEADFRCGVRVYAEERGMRASGREERGEVRSLLGFLLEQAGPRAFFRHLEELGQAAFLDSRVLFHHCRWDPSPADRFYSDLLQPEAVQDRRVREFTLAARETGIPVVLGGHSLVSGGLWALADIVSGRAGCQATGPGAAAG